MKNYQNYNFSKFSVLRYEALIKICCRGIFLRHLDEFRALQDRFERRSVVGQSSVGRRSVVGRSVGRSVGRRSVGRSVVGRSVRRSVVGRSVGRSVVGMKRYTDFYNKLKKLYFYI